MLVARLYVAALVVVVVAGCAGSASSSLADDPSPAESPAPNAGPSSPVPSGGGSSTVRLAFAGDVHFELFLAGLLDHPRGALGPITTVLRSADVSMVNLETAITTRGRPEAKELEEPGNRYWFRTSPAALDVLAAAGVDVATVANNHGADYGPVGVHDTLRAAGHSRVHVVGVGADRHAAFTPYRVTVRGTSFAFFGADASFREDASPVWAAGPHSPGLAAAHAAKPHALLQAVHSASRHDDVVVVYLHWGEELQGCPTAQQHITARALARAGADIVVGSHAHVLLGSGWLGDTYIDYGLGNFVWYHNQQPDTGILQLTVRDGQVVGDTLTPARIHADGRPHPLTGPARTAAVTDWRRLRHCTGLTDRPTPTSGPTHPPTHSLPAYTATIRPIGPHLRHRMRYSHHPGCPTPLTDLRYLHMTYLGFDHTAHTGEMVIHKTYAADITDVFHQLYQARWPIQRMRLIDDYHGHDNQSMANNNTSGYNCRHIAGTNTWSAHAYGAAIDINPAQNPYLTPTAIHPPTAAPYAHINRTPTAPHHPGVIQAGDPAVTAFNHIGWQWGGQWPNPKDYQHFTPTH